MSNTIPSMYGQDDEADEKASTTDPVSQQTSTTSGKTTRITIGAISYEVPSVAYVRQLEQALVKQDAAIQRLMREIIVVRQSLKRAAKPSDVEELRREMREFGS